MSINRKWARLAGMLMLAVLLPVVASAKSLAKGRQLITDKAYTTVVNDKHIVIGLDGKDKLCIRKSFGLTLSGFKEMNVLDCYAMAAIAQKGEEEDTLRHAEHITLVNTGVIEIHTKGIVERCKDLMSIPQEKENQFEYLRLIALCSAGEHNTLINKGTIEIHLDHDPSTKFTVYCYGMASNKGDGTFINKGTITFRGTGSVRTRLRGIGIQGSESTSINFGVMDMDVDFTEDCRMITMASDSCNVINDGVMRGNSSGTIIGMTRYGASNIVNNGTLELTAHSLPVGQKWFVSPTQSFVTGIYESVHKERKLPTPPIVNKGTIGIKIEGNNRMPAFYQGYGMMVHKISGANQKVGIANYGKITVSQTGSKHFDMAEVGVVTEGHWRFTPCDVEVGRWNTSLRDFSQSQDLFLIKGGCLDLNGADLCLASPEGYKEGTSYSISPESIVVKAKGEYINRIYGYDQMSVSAIDGVRQRIDVDKDAQTACLTSLPEKGMQIVNTESGQTIVNTKHIVVGLGSNDFCYKQQSHILGHGTGAIEAYTLDCTALASINLKGNVHDPAGRTDNVTIINKGVIELHTRNLVERFKDSIQTEAHPERPYVYLRVNGISVMGENCKLVNEGLIDVYFDHDPNTEFTVYSFALLASDKSSVINRGQIRFHGNGSAATRMRGIGSMGNYVKCINEGSMTMDVDVAEDSRMITTGGMYNEVVNNGVMKGRATGCLLGITRFGDSQIVNNGTICLTAVKTPQGIELPLRPADRHVCGMYDFISLMRKDISPMANHGTISINIEGADVDYYIGCGMLTDVVSPNDRVIEIVNDGKITTSKTAPGYHMAEAAFIDRSAKGATAHIRLGRWDTTLRDYSRSHDLFLAKGIDMDFGGGELHLQPAPGYQYGTAYSVDPAHLIYNIGDEKAAFGYRGYNTFGILSADTLHSVRWDKKGRTVSMSNQEN